MSLGELRFPCSFYTLKVTRTINLRLYGFLGENFDRSWGFLNINNQNIGNSYTLLNSNRYSVPAVESTARYGKPLWIAAIVPSIDWLAFSNSPAAWMLNKPPAATSTMKIKTVITIASISNVVKGSI